MFKQVNKPAQVAVLYSARYSGFIYFVFSFYVKCILCIKYHFVLSQFFLPGPRKQVTTHQPNFVLPILLGAAGFSKNELLVPPYTYYVTVCSVYYVQYIYTIVYIRQFCFGALFRLKHVVTLPVQKLLSALARYRRTKTLCCKYSMSSRVIKANSGHSEKAKML
jgi:hypothetical protein